MNAYPYFLFSVVVSLAPSLTTPADHEPDNVVIASGSSQSVDHADTAPLENGTSKTDDFRDFDSDAIYEPAPIEENAETVIDESQEQSAGSEEENAESEADSSGEAIVDENAEQESDSKDVPSPSVSSEDKSSHEGSPSAEPAPAGMKMTFQNEQSRPIELSVDSSVAIDLEKKIDLAQVTNPEVTP